MRHHNFTLKYFIFFNCGLVLGVVCTCLLVFAYERDITKPGCLEVQDASRNRAASTTCVCGAEVDRLKRLAKLALYVESKNVTGTGAAASNCGRRPRRPTASSEDVRQMRSFLYPNTNKTIDLDYNHAAMENNQYQPRNLNEEYVFKKQLFVAVLTQQAYLKTRAKSLYSTWGKHIDKLIFFVGEDCNISADLAYLPIVKLDGIPDQVYPPLKKTFAVMKYMYHHYTSEFNWFMRADDDMYLRVDKLKNLLSQIHPYGHVYMGRAGTGRKDDLGRLLLLPHEKYCMGGPGIIISTATLRELGPHLSNCLEAVLHHSKSSYNDDDVELGRCISRKINIQCSSSVQSRTYFFTDYKGGSLNPVTLWTTPKFQSVISIHPVKDPNHMQAFHYFYESLELQRSYEDMHTKIEYLNNLCRHLPAYATPPLSVSAACNLRFHPTSNVSSTISSILSGSAVILKDKVPFYLRPNNRFDIYPWTRFNNTLIQQVHGIAPEHGPSETMQAELFDVFKRLQTYLHSHYPSSVVTISRIIDGYMRFNPHLGREYLLTLKLDQIGRSPLYHRYHMIRELGPAVSVINLPSAPSSITLNVILPLQKVGTSFREFLQSFIYSGVEHGGRAKLHIVLVVFPTVSADEMKAQVRYLNSKTHPVSASLVVADGKYDYHRGVQVGVKSLGESDGLLFLADVNLRFSPEFFRRCRYNSQIEKRVYYPVAFQLYDWSFKAFSSNSNPPLSADTGRWDPQYFSHLCIYKKDFVKVGGYKEGQTSHRLFKAITSSHLDVFQAPDPDLFRSWTSKRCKDLEESKKRTCLNLKRAGLFEQADRADYLKELKMLQGRIL